VGSANTLTTTTFVSSAQQVSERRERTDKDRDSTQARKCPRIFFSAKSNTQHFLVSLASVNSNALVSGRYLFDAAHGTSTAVKAHCGACQFGKYSEAAAETCVSEGNRPLRLEPPRGHQRHPPARIVKKANTRQVVELVFLVPLGG